MFWSIFLVFNSLFLQEIPEEVLWVKCHEKTNKKMCKLVCTKLHTVIKKSCLIKFKQKNSNMISVMTFSFASFQYCKNCNYTCLWNNLGKCYSTRGLFIFVYLSFIASISSNIFFFSHFIHFYLCKLIFLQLPSFTLVSLFSGIYFLW